MRRSLVEQKEYQPEGWYSFFAVPMWKMLLNLKSKAYLRISTFVVMDRVYDALTVLRQKLGNGERMYDVIHQDLGTV